MTKLNQSPLLNKSNTVNNEELSKCSRENVEYIRDALYVVGGKWKIAIIFSLRKSPKRFSELQRILKIGPKMLAKELRELELNEFVVREICNDSQVKILYKAVSYSESLITLLSIMRDWGITHRNKIKDSMRDPIKKSINNEILKTGT